jgi:hypothetical protein
MSVAGKKRKGRDDQALDHQDEDASSLDEHFEVHDGAPLVDIWMVPHFLDRWFKTESNFSGSRIKSFGSWTCEGQGVDWNDFDAVLNKYPNLASFKEEADHLYVPIIFHCLHAGDPAVPGVGCEKVDHY